MAKKGIQNSSIEQVRKDHESETAFKTDNNKKQKNKKRR
ncbi:biofilm-forming protein [Gracilibacillus sp. HCP3S3_G5_1]